MSDTQTVVFREAYDCQRLIQRHPLVDVRERLASMVRKGFLDRSRGLYKKTADVGCKDPSKIVRGHKGVGDGFDSEVDNLDRGGAMEEYKHSGHQHPLCLLNEMQISKLSEKAECWMCAEKASAPCFGREECHGFYLHKSCADAPSQIDHPFHCDHPLVLLQTPPYALNSYICDFCIKAEEDFKSWDYIICHDKVNEELGNNSCLDCKITLHVNCVTKYESSYFVVYLGKEDEKSSESLKFIDKSVESITCVFQRNNAGDAIEVKHIKHKHDLLLSDKIIEVKHVWHHRCREPLKLTLGSFILCEVTSSKHQHPLFFYKDYKGQCSACGLGWTGVFRSCDTSAHVKCVVGQRSFVRLKGGYKVGEHPHRVTVAKKIYYYPNSAEYDKPCQDLAFECTAPGCNYIVHWRC
ncbi:Pentatricopeptide repeat superfamily protein isoform 1 [Hibiscus syriacus]|uniref:Pentatricopeptide repeat superfamily protein isoform 1 n=1 Tax=Hibiscus syriacus TaxID=106335 RepID=A0A6A3CX24_HIBSY|nr:Pentatricopeptide repeat superfamily protein isoform 1 [Hibiscus syriacus]